LNPARREARRRKGLAVDDGAGSLFHHSVAILYAPAYASENATALQRDWPRIPLPASKAAFERSEELGRLIARLLDLDDAAVWERIPEPGGIGVIAREGGKAIDPKTGELEVTAGWGHCG
jgi:hypothetical protein